MSLEHPVTTGGRYFVVKGDLWRSANLNLLEREKSSPVSEFKQAPRAVNAANQKDDAGAETAAYRDVDAVEYALGERGHVCWTNGDEDLNRQLLKNTSDADRFATHKAQGRSRWPT